MNYTMLSRDTRPIFRVVFGDTWYTVGALGVTKISVVDEHGEMAYVPWFEVWKGDTLYSRVNSKYIREVFYQEGQTQDVYHCRCERCGHEWDSKEANGPATCPNRKCHSPYWRTVRQKPMNLIH